MTTPMTDPSAPTSPTAATADRLLGTWRLVSYQDVDEEGSTSDGPLGPAPAGLLHYLADGYMAVSMMRTGEDRPGDREPGRQHETFMGYAGRWELADGRVIHRAEVSAHPFQIGIEQVREVVLDGDELTLLGSRPNSDRPQRRMLRWRRADHEGVPER